MGWEIRTGLGAITGFLLGFLVGCSTGGVLSFVLPILLFFAGGYFGHLLDHQAHSLALETAKTKHDEAKAELLKKHNVDEIFLNIENGQFVGISWNVRRIVFRVDGGQTHLFSFKQLMDVEMETLTTTWSETDTNVQTNRGSQIIGAAVGGAAFGAAGAIIGGLSGSQKSDSTTTSHTYDSGYILRCRILDRNNPTIEITFYRAGTDVAWPPPLERKQACMRFHAHLSNILHESRSTDFEQ